MPRWQQGAVLHDPVEAAAQAVSVARDGIVVASDGSRLAVSAQTLSLHGDTPGASEIARAVRAALSAAGVGVAPLGGDAWRARARGGPRAGRRTVPRQRAWGG